MEIEIPCRDTDPIDGKMVTKGETLAFTIDFGGSDTSSEKAKKFERFAQRSSQRRTASPRDVKQENNEAMTNQASWTQTDKTLGKLCTDYHQEKKNISKERATIQNEKVQNVQRTFDRIKIKDLEIDNEDEKDEVRSSTGTYVMEDEEELKEVSPPMDRAKYVEDWTAKHCNERSSLSRRKLPEAPGNSSPDSSSEGIDVSFDNLKRTGNIRPFERFRNLSMPKKNQISRPQGLVKSDYDLKGRITSEDTTVPRVITDKNSTCSMRTPTSARSESSGYNSRQETGRLSTRKKQVSQATLSKGPSRSSSSLTSREADFQAWKRRKEYKPFNSSSRSSQGTRPAYSEKQTPPNPPCKQPLMMTQSLKINPQSQSIQRANSFHQENMNKVKMRAVQENSEDSGCTTYRTSDDYYLDEDELILPIFPQEKQIVDRPGKNTTKLSSLDTLVISTTHNVSSKLCQAAAKIIRKAAQQVPEEDEDQRLTMETITFLLEDTHTPSNYRNKTSVELAGAIFSKYIQF